MKHIIDDSDKNKYEAYTKAEVLAVVQEAISSGELPEEINGLVITLKNPVDNAAYKIAFCTQAKYNELEQAGTLEANCYYFITDDTSYDDIVAALNDLINNVTTLQNQVATNTTNITTLQNKVKYAHVIQIHGTDGTNSWYLTFTLISSSNFEPNTIPQLITLIKTIPEYTNGSVFQASGVYNEVVSAYTTNKKIIWAVGLVVNSDTDLGIELHIDNDTIEEPSYSNCNVNELFQYTIYNGN